MRVCLCAEKVRSKQVHRSGRSFHLKMRALSIEGKVATEDGLLEMKRRLPQYPHKCLKLTLSDGTVELDAIELEPLGLRLGATPMGTKVSTGSSATQRTQYNGSSALGA